MIWGSLTEQIYARKKLLGTATVNDLSDLVRGEEKVSWEGLGGGKGFVSVGLTAEDFGKGKGC